MDNSIALVYSLIILNTLTFTKATDYTVRILYYTLKNRYWDISFKFTFQSNILSAEGYQNEVHSVTTADKYILNLHRIPSSKPLCKSVVIVHGLGSSSTSFLITGPGIRRENSISN